MRESWKELRAAPHARRKGQGQGQPQEAAGAAIAYSTGARTNVGEAARATEGDGDMILHAMNN